MEQGAQVHCIYNDFEKAFDRFNHDILLKKLWQYGFPYKTISFSATYLSGRTFRVSCRNHLSDTVTVNSGVPQGGNTGPNLFRYQIKDLLLMFTIDERSYAC